MQCFVNVLFLTESDWGEKREKLYKNNLDLFIFCSVLKTAISIVFIKVPWPGYFQTTCGVDYFPFLFRDCGSVQGTCEDDSSIMYAWARNAPPTKLPKSKSNTLIIQMYLQISGYILFDIYV